MVVAALTVALASAPLPAQACASCACGDPTLTALGSELPFAGRLRLALLASTRSEQAGQPRHDEVQAVEQRLTLGVSWSPLDALTVGLSLPLVRKEAEMVSGRTHQGYGLADVGLRGRWSWRVGSAGSRQVFSLHGGVDLPTTPELEAEGASLPIEAQPSSGAVSGLAGASYALSAWPWSLYASATGRASTAGHLHFTQGPALLTTVAGQYQLSTAWALGLSLDARLDGPADEHGARDPHSGGFLGMLAPELRWSPITDWMISLQVQVPVVVALRGDHGEGVGATLGITCDL